MWTLSQDITGLLHAARIKYTFTNSLIYLLTYLLTYKYTQVCLFLWTAYVYLSSNSVDWCGSKSHDPHTFVNQTTLAREQHCQPPTKLFCAAAAAVMAYQLNREDVEWAKYKNKQGDVWCDHWSSCCKVICVCWMARSHPVAYWSPTGCLLGTFHAVFKIIIALLGCLWNGLHIGLLCAFV